MDKRATAGHSDNKHSYPPSPWTASTPTATADNNTHTPKLSTPKLATSSTTLASSSALATPSSAPLNADASYDAGASAATSAPANGSPYSQHLGFLPFLLPNQSDIYHAQLLHYNRLISPNRGGGLQAQALPPIVSAPNVHAAPRSRSTSKVSLKDSATSKGTGSGGHGSRSQQHSDKNRSVLTAKEAPHKMPAKQPAELSKSQPTQRQRPQASSSSHNHGQPHSSSVPSTPHQRARQFSLGSRDPSPTANANHSPRSAYSETNGALPSLRPLPPRLGGCRYETAQTGARRRIPYSVGSDRLEQLDLRTVKSKLTEEEERKLATDMREVYDRLLPTARVEDNRKRMVKKLESIFNDEWQGHDIRVHPFGSSGNLLCSDDSDVDICITTSWQEMENVCMIANLLAQQGMEKVVCISGAKVPIVKIWDPELRLACDMNVNNTLALENTRMIRTYVEIDPRVRQLGMIIKHWTRKRIINDAALGGTLSSYTWICLIIAFLQLRDPPVLPALHQLPYKTLKADGTVSDFADNLKKLKGFGNKNDSSVADLLFQFFRFYAHEFDYQKHVLSVRQGKLLTKKDKGWQLSNNNDLCVEEPFNVSRNLGNTLDEYTFHGIHQELRRAFDLVSVAKFDEACEQFVFPKEEEKTFTRPPPQPRPALLRSASQTHSGRGGRGSHRGGRHNHNSHRGGGGGGGGSNRRSSSSVPTYDNANMFMQPMMQQDLAWYQNPHFQMPYVQQDLMAAHMAYQQENLRHLQLYAQSPAYLQQQQQMMGQHRGTNHGTNTAPSSSNRSRTNSFDKGPLTSPLRPELYALYGMNLNPAFYQQANTVYGTYPSTPVAMTGGNQDFRRPLQRTTTGMTEPGQGSGSSLRSQSQPAARSPSATQTQAAVAATGGTTAAVPAYAGQNLGGIPSLSARSPSGVPIPSFISDDTDFDETPKAISDSPLSEKVNTAGFFAARDGSPKSQDQQTPSSTSTIAFGDIANQAAGSGRRRLSTEQLPQSLIDRRVRRQSRSPSPLGHNRATSIGAASAPLSAAPFPGGHGETGSSNPPLVVNGSGLNSCAVNAFDETTGDAASGTEYGPVPNFHNPLRIQSSPFRPNYTPTGTATRGFTTAVADQGQHVAPDAPPVIVNGSGLALNPPSGSESSFRERIAMMDSYYMNPLSVAQDPAAVAGAHVSGMANQRPWGRPPQNGVIAPLDLAIRDSRMANSTDSELSHLSPVYEAPAPSPTAIRKQNAPKVSESSKPLRADLARSTPGSIERPSGPSGRQDGQKAQKGTKQAMQHTTRPNAPRESGHVRGAKSESDSGWQKAGKGKKKQAGAVPQLQQIHGKGELFPKYESERKGG